MHRRLGGTNEAQYVQGIIIFSMEKKTKNYQLGKGFLYTTK
jgi:hypothetical protein